jgi:hypothetical protein
VKRRRRGRRAPRARLCPADPGSAVRALTAAALALPSLAPASRAAEDDGFTFSFGRYEEGDRDLDGAHSAFDPISADTLRGTWRLTPADRWQLALDFVQDTWSGATPITTAPLVVGGNRPPPDATSGATPYINGDLFLDGSLRPLAVDELGEVQGVDTRLVHTLSAASPEARREVSVGIGYAWDDVRLDGGAGVSLEQDFRSRFVRAGGAWDLPGRQTRVGVGASYTHSRIDAELDHDAVPYIDTSGFDADIDSNPATGDRTLEDDQHDVGAHAEVTHALDPDTLVAASVAYDREQGYLANPYRVFQVAFIDPEQQILAPPGGYFAQVRALLERVPGTRHRLTAGLRVNRFIAATGGALHAGYRLYADDWGILAHTFEARLAQPVGDLFVITPRIRYYSQGEADFYRDYAISDQAYSTTVIDPDTGELVAIIPFDHGLLPRHYSSDYRLSGFGALAGGVTLSVPVYRGIRLAGDFEYRTQQGDLRLGGAGVGDFADFDAWLLSVSIALDASALHAGGDHRDGAHAAGERAPHPGVPAGVAMGHMLDRPGDLMLATRYLLGMSDGDVLHGSGRASDAEIAANGCGAGGCRTAPDTMDMHMVMLELMWAPTRWLTLMAMPSYMVHEMDVRALAGAEPDPHGAHDHTTGGLGDVGVAALVRLLDGETHHLHAGLGVSLPVGSVDEELRRTHQENPGLTHYDMQLGSGTFDLLPSLTLAGSGSRLWWGAQVTGAVRMEHANASGYALGDALAASAWGGVRVLPWLSGSVRAIYTVQGRVRGAYDRLHDDAGPMDFPANTGGRFFDVGLGLGVDLGGRFAGHQLGAEWLQPVAQDPNGYQLERVGALSLVWGVRF